MRLYEPVWNELKAKGKAFLKVKPAYAATVRKAVKKEKAMDLAFKVTHDYDSWRLVICYDAEKCIMHFILKQKLGFE